MKRFEGLFCVDINQLKANEYNPRKNTDHQKEKLKQSIEQFGLVKPIVVNQAPERNNIVIGGHFRLKVAKELGFKEIAVVYVNLPEIKDEKRLNVTLNKVQGEFDYELLADFDEAMLADIGFDSIEIDDIFDCGTCGANITAEEKFKPLKDGSFNRHVYYRCIKSANPNCPEKYLNEKKLVFQLSDFIAKNHKDIKLTKELKRKCTDHADTVEDILESRGIKEDTVEPLVEYSRFILAKDTYSEQGELVQGIQNKFVVRSQKLEVS